MLGYSKWGEKGGQWSNKGASSTKTYLEKPLKCIPLDGGGLGLWRSRTRTGSRRKRWRQSLFSSGRSKSPSCPKCPVLGTGAWVSGMARKGKGAVQWDNFRGFIQGPLHQHEALFTPLPAPHQEGEEAGGKRAGWSYQWQCRWGHDLFNFTCPDSMFLMIWVISAEKRAGACVCGTRRGKGGRRRRREGIWLWGDKRHRKKRGKAGEPRYFSIFTFCSGPSKSTSASPGSPEMYWREISTGRKSKLPGLFLALCSGACAWCRGVLGEGDVLGGPGGQSASKGARGLHLLLLTPFLLSPVLSIPEKWLGAQASCLLPAFGSWLSHLPPVWPWDRVFDLSVSQFPPP